MAKEIQFTASQMFPRSGSVTGRRPSGGAMAQPGVQASGAGGTGGSNAATGVLAIIVWLIVMRIAWELVT